MRSTKKRKKKKTFERRESFYLSFLDKKKDGIYFDILKTGQFLKTIFAYIKQLEMLIKTI